MIVIYFFEGVKGVEFLFIFVKKGVVFVGGIYKEIVIKYICFGYMGVSVVSNFSVFVFDY